MRKLKHRHKTRLHRLKLTRIEFSSPTGVDHSRTFAKYHAGYATLRYMLAKQTGYRFS